MTKDKLAEKVAKLLRIAQSDAGPQGDTARRLAEEILSKHGIEVPKDEPPPDKHCFIVDMVNLVWKASILSAVADHYRPCTFSVNADKTHAWMWLHAPPDVLRWARIHYEYLVGITLNLSHEGRAYYKTWQPRPWGDYDEVSVRDGIAACIVEQLRTRETGFGFSDDEAQEIQWEPSPLRTALPAPALDEGAPSPGSEEDSTTELAVVEEVQRVKARPLSQWTQHGYRMGGARISTPYPRDLVFAATADLPVHKATRDALVRAGYAEVSDLLTLTETQLLGLKGIGPARIAELQAVLFEEAGFRVLPG